MKPLAARTLTYRLRSREVLISRSPATVKSASWVSVIHLLLKNADSRYEATRMISRRPYLRVGPPGSALARSGAGSPGLACSAAVVAS